MRVRLVTLMVSDGNDPASGADGPPRKALSVRRLAPLGAIVLAAGLIVAMGWHEQLSFATLIEHRAAIRDFIADNQLSAVAAYVALYIAVVALSVPGAVFLTVAGGILFGAVLGAAAAITGATLGAIAIFLIARSAIGELLARRAGPLVTKLAENFRVDAFSYLLFLRLVPLFPFWLVNLVPALCGVRLATFAGATVLGIIPATVAFAVVGAGLDSMIRNQELAYLACLGAGRTDCRLAFDTKVAITPELIAALVALGVVALIPVVVKRLRARSRLTRASG